MSNGVLSGGGLAHHGQLVVLHPRRDRTGRNAPVELERRRMALRESGARLVWAASLFH